MDLVLLAVGRMKAGPERELLTRYVERARAMSRPLGLGAFVVKEIEESRAREASDRKREEARDLLAVLRPGSRVVCLDERGMALSSQAFSDDIGKARDRNCPALALVIGGPDGLDTAFRQAADLVCAYGAATFPHQLVRVLAAEQLYRAMTILAGHPYHRA